MKTLALGLTAAVIMSFATFISCKSPSEKVETAQENVNDANKDLNQANQDYLVEVEEFRKAEALKIAENNKSIAEFKARIEKDKSSAKADYRKKIALLEQKNTDSQKKLDDYKAESKENWEQFKAEFNRDMNELGKSISDFFSTGK